MTKQAVASRDFGSGSSVVSEVSRDYRATLQAVKQVLGEKHILTTTLLHACVFPTDRMSLKMVWDQFSSLPVAQKSEILHRLRSRII